MPGATNTAEVAALWSRPGLVRSSKGSPSASGAEKSKLGRPVGTVSSVSSIPSVNLISASTNSTVLYKI